MAALPACAPAQARAGGSPCARVPRDCGIASCSASAGAFASRIAPWERAPVRRTAHATAGAWQQRRQRRWVVLSAGGGVADKPLVVPNIDWAKDTKRKKPPQYRVMLHNDNFNRREYVVQVLLKVVDGMTVDDAVNVMNEAHINGLAAVIVCTQEDAERYCEGLRSNGLISSIEPCGPTGT